MILTLIVTTPPVLMAMEVPTLKTALEAERAHHPEEAIRGVEVLLNSNALLGRDVVTAWDILGLSYADEGRLDEARRAYEKAIASFDAIPEASSRPSDLGDLLSNLGDVYSQMYDSDTALHLRLKALSLYQQVNNLTGIARSYIFLAGMELNQKHIRSAKKYLAAAYAALPNAASIDSDDRAEFYMVRGWELEKERDYRGELSSYTIAMQLWRDRYGDDYGMTGWAHMVLGKAYANINDISSAENEMQRGLPILKNAFGEHSVRYLTAELAYSRVLDRMGSRNAAESLRRTAETEITTLFGEHCSGCVISADALR